MKKALVLAGGVPQIKLIKELHSRGYYVILADYTKEPVAQKYSDKFYCESTLDIDAIRNIAKSENVDLITTCCTDQALVTVSVLSQELKLPCYINADVGRIVTNKQYMKKRFSECKIPTAEFRIVDNARQKIDMEYPLVVKPVDCNSSKGVLKVTSNVELQSAIRSALRLSRSNFAIVEKYIEGQEVSVDAFVKNRKAWILCQSFTEKVKNNSKFVINRGLYPAILTQSIKEKIQVVVQKIADAFHIENGPMLVQLLVKGDEIFVIEFSARTGGCIKYNMIELVSGVDVIKLMLDVTEGKEIELDLKKQKKVVVNEFVYASKGIFSHIEGIDECKKRGWIHDAFILKTEGSVIEGVASSGDRIAALTYVTDTFENYQENQKEVYKHVKIIDHCGKNVTRYDLLENR